MRQFFDTNIFIYAFLAGEAKADLALSALTKGDAVISVQVLNEFVRVARGKHRLDWMVVDNMTAAIIRRCRSVEDITLPLHQSAMALAERHLLPVYDALILAAALEARCDRLVSEDFQNGRRFGRLEIANPFNGLRP